MLLRTLFKESETLENTVEDLQKARGRLEDMEGQLTELNERLEDEEDNNAEITALKHKLEDEIEDLKQEISELGTTLDKVMRCVNWVHNTCTLLQTRTNYTGTNVLRDAVYLSHIQEFKKEKTRIAYI